jgi:Fur family transcriptional regulator, ferric uptake regulator
MASESHRKNILHHFRLKVTSARLRVLDVFIRSEAALSHGDILARIHDAHLDKVTLYRTLDAFVKCGLVHKVATEDRKWLYALHHNGNEASVNDEHAHFICDECERVYCVPVVAAGGMKLQEGDQGFVVRSREYRLHGTCPQCH